MKQPTYRYHTLQTDEPGNLPQRRAEISNTSKGQKVFRILIVMPE